MITGEDLKRLEEEAAKKEQQMIVIDTHQFFEIVIPKDVDPEKFLDSDICRQFCANKILDQTVDLNLDHILARYDPKTEEWTEEE